MIFYFSGTGNSQLAALRIAEQLEDGLVSINRCLKHGEPGSLHSSKPLVFVVPTYSWRIPKAVERWIMEADFTGSQEAYFVLTCGGSVGNAAAYAKRLCEKKGLAYRGLSGIAMPENYLALGPTPTEAECSTIIEQAKPRIDRIAQRIREGAPLLEQPVTFSDKLKSGPVNPLFYSLYVHDKGFTASNDCTSCGACEQRCPLNNIEMANGKPVWKGSCTHCMACIAGCPVEAIEYKSVSQGRHRHYVMDDELCQRNGA